MVQRKRMYRGTVKAAEFKPLNVKVNLYSLLADAVENGIDLGWMHAHKHTDTPDEFAVKRAIHDDTMAAICELIDFEASR